MALAKFGLRVDIKQEEKYNFGQLFMLSFLTGLATSFYSVTTSSYFIKKLDVSQLPSAYILSGLVGYLLILVYKRIMNAYGLYTAMVMSNILYVVICSALLYARLHDASSVMLTQVVAFAGFVFVMPFSSLFALSFATFGLRIMDLGQSKRLLALVGMGEVVASILAYLMVPLLTKIMGGTAFLLLITIVSVLAGILPLTRLLRANKEKISHVHATASAIKVNVGFLLKDKYFLLIGVFTFFSVIAIYLADYSYLLSVKFLSVENNIETAVLVSIIFTIIKVGELAFSLFSSRFIGENGMKTSLLLLPLLLAGSSIVGFISGSVFTSITFFIVAFLLLNKWIERVIRKGITNPALKVLYQVTKPAERAKVQTLIDGSLSQVSTIAAGVVLLILSLLFKKTQLFIYLFILAGICFLVYGAWLFFTQKLYGRYKEKIQAYLRSSGAAAVTDDSAAVHAVEQWLASSAINRSAEAGIRELADTMGTIAQNEHNNKKALAFERVSQYNEKAFKNITGMNDDLLPRRLSGVLYSNDYYPGKIATIRYAAYLPDAEKIKLLKSNYETLDHTLQYLLLHTVNTEPLQCAPEDIFYFTGLCRHCVEDILWIEQTLEDLAPAEDEKLNKALESLWEEKVFQLLQLLRILYEPGSIGIVEKIWWQRGESPENQVFAIELLENILDRDMKKIIIPLLDGSPVSVKKEKLREVFYFHHFEIPDRLKDIIMKDFNLVDPYIKELAVLRYIAVTGDKDMVKVFKGNPYSRLTSLATQEDHEELMQQERSLARQLGLPEEVYKKKVFDVLNKWVVQSDMAKVPVASGIKEGIGLYVNIKNNEGQYSVDCNGLCLLLEAAALQDQNITIK